MLNLNIRSMFSSLSVISTRHGPLSASRSWMLLNVDHRGGLRTSFFVVLSSSIWNHFCLISLSLCLCIYPNNAHIYFVCVLDERRNVNKAQKEFIPHSISPAQVICRWNPSPFIPPSSSQSLDLLTLSAPRPSHPHGCPCLGSGV